MKSVKKGYMIYVQTTKKRELRNNSSQIERITDKFLFVWWNDKDFKLVSQCYRYCSTAMNK